MCVRAYNNVPNLVYWGSAHWYCMYGFRGSVIGSRIPSASLLILHRLASASLL